VGRKPEANLGADEQEPDTRLAGRGNPATDGKPDSQTDALHVNPAALERRISVLPREISPPLQATGAGCRQRPPTSGEKSADAIVALTTGRRAEFDTEGAAWSIRCV